MENKNLKVLALCSIAMQFIALAVAYYYAQKIGRWFDAANFGELPGVTYLFFGISSWLFVCPVLTMIFAVKAIKQEKTNHISIVIFLSLLVVFVVLLWGLVGLGQMFQ